MALTPANVTASLAASLVSTGHLGQAVPLFAQAIANGVMLWIPLVRVQTVDAGTLGVGAGLIPLLVPSPVLQTALQVGFAAQGLVGSFAPTTALGLASGLSVAFAQGQVVTTHPSVGVGTGICTFRAPPAATSMQAGFVSTGMAGPGTAKMALAIAQALDTVFSALVLTTPVAGSPSPTGSSGVGSGQIA